MREISIFALALMLTSCDPKLEKPFTITGKSNSCTYCEGNVWYQYQDAKGHIHGFYEDPEKYEVGDIIE